MDFRILGPLEVLDDDRIVVLGGSRQRALLAVLLLHANETLSTDRLIDELWPEAPPAAATKTVQVGVSRLRRALAGDEPIVTRAGGYQLEVDPERIDAERFKRLVDRARAELGAGRPALAMPALEEANAMWRGPPLADLSYEPFAQREIARLTDLRVAARELLVEARLALGGHAEVVGELEALIAEHPYRERLRGQLMLALYRSDRQAEALQAYQEARRALVEELGIEPGERLRELERAILAQDPSLALPEPAVREPPRAPPPEPPATDRPRSARRLVSVLVAELLPPAERLDPESRHALLDRGAEACSAVIERHGGSVEGFTGDAIVGVFGLAQLHEDDALRAVRAAAELRDGEMASRVGADAGEVFVGSGTRRTPFATGDAFTTAARLQAGAGAGDILVGQRLHDLLGPAARVEHIDPIAAPGRIVAAWRLLGLDGEDPVRPPAVGTPFAGRRGELDELRAAFARTLEERACRAVMVLGPAGIGKSRLVRELVAEVRAVATVAVGRCLSYGEGITYRPLAEIVGQLAGPEPRRRLAELLEDERLARAVLGAIGLDDGPAQPDETFWAVRRLLERVAEDRPLVVVVDDVHWAEPTLLDLVEHLTSFSTGHAILVVCIARPEFVEMRPGWVVPQGGRTLLALDPLPDDAAGALVQAAARAGLGERAAARIVERAEGNPFFLEQLVAVGAGGDDGALPSSIQAVLAARIDRLRPRERDALEEASVQGVSFHVDASRTSGDLLSLVRQGLIRAERPTLPGRDAFRFTHALIREAAYRGLPRQRRAELHEAVAAWLESAPGAHDETIGHHLAQACEQLAELGVAGEREAALAATAARRLENAAGAALLRGDAPAGARLLERAAGLLAPDDPARAALLPSLGAALLQAGRLADADRLLTGAIEDPAADPWLRARASVERGLVRLQGGSGAPAQDAGGIATSALEVLEADGDELGQCRALCLRALHAWVEGRSADADDAWERAAAHARRAGESAALPEILGWRASAALFGPTPVGEAIERCRTIGEELSGSKVAVARTFHPLAALHAMAGNATQALRLVAAGDEILGEAGGLHTAVAQEAALAELLAGRPAEAEARLRRGYELLDEMGEKALLAGTAAMLAQVLHARGETEEAAELSRVGEAAAAKDDLAAQVGWRGVRARLLAGDGRAEEARALAEEAVRIASRTDFLTVHAEALADLAAVLRAQGRAQDADRAQREAAGLYRRKGAVASLAGRHDHTTAEEDHAQVLEHQDRRRHGPRDRAVQP